MVDPPAELLGGKLLKSSVHSIVSDIETCSNFSMRSLELELNTSLRGLELLILCVTFLPMNNNVHFLNMQACVHSNQLVERRL